MQNLVAVLYCVGIPNELGNVGDTWDEGEADPPGKTPLPICYHAEFGCSR